MMERLVLTLLEKSTGRVKVSDSIDNLLCNDAFRIALAIVVSLLYCIQHLHAAETKQFVS